MRMERRKMLIVGLGRCYREEKEEIENAEYRALLGWLGKLWRGTSQVCGTIKERQLGKKRKE